MIQPLRTAHRRMFVALAFLLPAIMMAGLSSRHQIVWNAQRANQTSPSEKPIKSADGLWRTHAIQTEFFESGSESGRLSVSLKPAQELSEPDLLVYWSASAPAGDSLPADARLLGAYSPGKALALPAEAAPGGRLTLYSLARQSVVDTATVERLP